MKPRTDRLLQNILEGRDIELNRPITATTLFETELDLEVLGKFDHADPLGISPGFNHRGHLVALAIADSKECQLVEFQHNRPKPGQATNQVSPEIVECRKLLQDKVFCREAGDLLAFDLGPLAMSLHKNLGIRVYNGIDIQSTFSAVDRKPISAIESALGDSLKIHQDNARNLFTQNIIYKGDAQSKIDLAMRAWISQFLASFGNGIMLFEKARRINTRDLTDEVSVISARP